MTTSPPSSGQQRGRRHDAFDLAWTAPLAVCCRAGLHVHCRDLHVAVMAMNLQWRARDHAFDPYDDSERVAERLREYTYAELRAEVEHYQATRRFRKGARPFGFRFGEYLRDQISRQLAKEDRESDAGCHEERSYYEY